MMGTSRNTRALPALAPDWLAIDGRKPRELLAQSAAMAKLFTYIDRAGAPAGQWDQFYTRVPLIRYAMLAEIRTDAADIRLQHALNKIGSEIDLNDDGHIAAAWNIIDRLLADYSLIDEHARAFAAWPEEWRFATELKDAIEPRLARDCRAVLECANWLRQEKRWPAYTLKGWTETDDVLTNPMLGQNGWEDAPRGTRFHSRSLNVGRDFVRTLSTAAWSTRGIVTELVTQAGKHFDWYYEKPKGLPPHAGLLLAFVRQFAAAQTVMNGITGDHCAFYYNKVLRAKPAPPRPDRTFVALVAANGQRVEIPVGTTLVAGKDSTGQPILYATLAPVTVSSATIARVAAVRLDAFNAPAFQEQGATGYYVTPPHLPPATPESPAWATFGETPADREQRQTAAAEIGFAISSPVLYLEEGRRVMQITWQFAAAAEGDEAVDLPATHAWQIDYTGPNGWINVAHPRGTLTAGRATNGTWLPKTLRLDLELGRGEPACVNGTKIHGPSYDLGAAAAPFVRVRFANPEVAFGTDADRAAAFLTAAVERVTIDVTAEGLDDLTLATDSGKLPSGKPGPLFGAPPPNGARLAIGKVELFRKRLRSLELQLEWHGLPTDEEDYPNGLRDYYARYLPAVVNPAETMFRNDQYRVAFSALSGGAWQRVDVALPSSAPAPFLFDWPGANASPSPAPAGPLATTRTLIADPAALATITPQYGLSGPLEFGAGATTGFLGLQLAAPEYLFGAALYPAAVSAAALENARMLVGAAMSDPAAEETAEKPFSGYMAIRFPKPPTFFARLAARLKIKTTRWYTFQPRIFPELARAKVPSAVAEAARAVGVSEANLLRGLRRLHDDVFKDEASCRRRIADQLRLQWPPSEPANTCIEAVIHWLAKLAGRAALDSGELAAMPPPPVVPTATVRITRYTAQAVIEPHGNRPSTTTAWDRLWQISPFAMYALPEVDDQAHPTWTPLLPAMEPGGYLYLGLSGVLPTERVFSTFPLSLLFALETAPLPNFQTPPVSPTWSYLVKDTWHDLSASAVHDGTAGFLRSGIVRLEQPTVIDATHTTMPTGFYWLRARVPDPSHRLKTLRILPHATEAAWQVPATLSPADAATHFAAPLPAGSITSLEVARPAIQKVLQPLPSFDGVPTEDITAFNCRVSERLRHKGRAVALRDYEQLLLELFPSVFYAQAFPPAAASESRSVRIMVLPAVREPPAVPPPSFVPGVLTEMERALKALAPLSAVVRVLNPDYDRVTVEVQVSFKADDVWSTYAQRLNEDLKALISPWIYRQADCKAPDTQLRAADVTHHLRTRLGSYITSVGLCRVWLEGERRGLGESVEATGRGRLLLSAGQHVITPLGVTATV